MCGCASNVTTPKVSNKGSKISDKSVLLSADLDCEIIYEDLRDLDLKVIGMLKKDKSNIILGENKDIILKVGTDRKLYKVNNSGYFENSRSVTFNPVTGKFEYTIVGLSETTAQELLPKVLTQELIVQLRKQLDVYAVNTLPVAPTAVIGQMAYVTDATAPTYLGALVGGGAVKCPVFFNGTAWVSH